MAQKIGEVISIQEAMDNLAAISSLDLNAPGPIGILRKTRIITDTGDFPEAEIDWLSGEGSEALLQVVDLTYRAIVDHLARLLTYSDVELNNERTVRGVAALMALVGETADRLEKYLELRLGKPIGKISERTDYRILQDFYQGHFLNKIKVFAPHETSEGIHDIEVVRKDQNYELFLVRHEDGSPFFNLDLLRHMRLISNFESEGENFEEDPLLQVRTMMDRNAGNSAREILSKNRDLIADFYKIFRKVSANDLALMLSSALTGLFLASNPKNLMQNTTGKTALLYFKDFQHFLRASFQTTEYQKMIAYPPEKSEKIAHALLSLTHALAAQFFFASFGVKQEIIGLIHRTARKGNSIKERGTGFWSQFLIDDENLRTQLSKFPSGPLLKILGLIRDAEVEELSFDPLAQENFPCKEFHLDWQGVGTEVLRIASPTCQSMINKAGVADEFRGMLRNLGQAKGKKHLLINLQDRTSWKEFARAKALENLQKNAEFNANLIVCTIPKSTPFYYQIEEYSKIDQADEFFASLFKQLETPEECGFYLPHSFSPAEMTRFAKAALPLIHKLYFENKKTLIRKEREDCIEIFYLFLILKLIAVCKPTSISFTCKDGVDTGAAQTASFYAFVKLLEGKFLSKEEHDYFRFLLYAPALCVRERAIDPERFTRMLSALEHFGTEIDAQELATIFPHIKDLSLQN